MTLPLAAAADDDASIALSVPDHGDTEREFVAATFAAPRPAGGSSSAGPMVRAFEQRFAAHLQRAHAVAVASGTLGTLLALRALGIGAGHGVIGSPYAWHQVAHAVAWAGATLKLGEIDYWSGCLDAARARPLLGADTQAAIVGNVNGHPAAWRAWRELAQAQSIALIEDCTESIGSRYDGDTVGRFGDVAVFDFSGPAALQCGGGGMLATDDAALARELRYLRERQITDRRSLSVGARVPLQAGMGELAAAIGIAQLARLPELLARRQAVQAVYREQMQTFEGIKPPYQGPDVDEVHWMLYVVHLGKRFTASALDQIVDDLAQQGIETARYCRPLHQQFHYQQLGHRHGQFPLTERIADRALALPLHGALDARQVEYIVQALKDATVNVGAGAAIY